MNKDWVKSLRKKPDRRERILFGVMLVVVSAVLLKSCIWADLIALNSAKAEIYSVKLPAPELKKSDSSKKIWIGSARAVREVSEIALDVSHIQGIKIIKNQFSALISEEGRQKRDVTLSAIGSYNALEQYLKYLGNMPAPLVISGFSIQKSAPDSDMLNLEVSGVVYGAN